jgi:hypothetical protein
MKNFNRLFLLLLLAAQPFGCRAQAEGDPGLQKRWVVYDGNSYRAFTADDDGNATTIYFGLNEYKPGDTLRVRSNHAFAVFINGKATSLQKAGKIEWSVDSLTHAFHTMNLFVGIHQKKIHRADLSTQIVNASRTRNSSGPDESLLLKPSTYFMDFVLVGSLIIIGMLVFVIRLNGKLAADYFSVTGIFSLRESEDSQLHGRITSSSNILFYSYCSLIISFYLMIIFHFVPAYFRSAWGFQATSFPMALVQWLKLSGFLLVIFFVKIILIYLFSRLFALHETFGIHVFNWIRLMLIFFGTFLIILIIYHITRGQDKEIYSIFMWAIAWIFGIWIIVVFPKVMRRTNYSLFHIFSYICATEIIPLLISIKIIYY